MFLLFQIYCKLLGCLKFFKFPLDHPIVLLYDGNSDRGVAQLGSAPLWGSGGRGFESRRSD